MEVQHSDKEVQLKAKKRWGLLGTPTSIYLIRFIYYIYNYRLLYYLPMERMKKEKKADQNAVAELTREWLYKENKWLWEENKKLKEKLSEITMIADDEKQSIEHILELEEENKKLKEELKNAECEFWFACEEIDYRKREDKELRKWIKEHVDYQTQADFRKRFEHK